jgi:hypothetical protein
VNSRSSSPLGYKPKHVLDSQYTDSRSVRKLPLFCKSMFSLIALHDSLPHLDKLAQIFNVLCVLIYI